MNRLMIMLVLSFILVFSGCQAQKENKEAKLSFTETQNIPKAVQDHIDPTLMLQSVNKA